MMLCSCCAAENFMRVFEHSSSMLSHTVDGRSNRKWQQQSNQITFNSWVTHMHTRERKRIHANQITCSCTYLVHYQTLRSARCALTQFHWKFNNIHQLCTHSLLCIQLPSQWPFLYWILWVHELHSNTVINTMTKYTSIVNSILFEFQRILC